MQTDPASLSSDWYVTFMYLQPISYMCTCPVQLPPRAQPKLLVCKVKFLESLLELIHVPLLFGLRLSAIAPIHSVI